MYKSGEGYTVSPTAMLQAPYSPDSPEQTMEERVGTALAKYVKTKQQQWSREDRIIAIKCVKDLVRGKHSDKSKQHSDERRVRFLHLNTAQSDLVFCLYQAAMTWDKPTLDALTSQLPT